MPPCAETLVRTHTEGLHVGVLAAMRGGVRARPSASRLSRRPPARTLARSALTPTGVSIPAHRIGSGPAYVCMPPHGSAMTPRAVALGTMVCVLRIVCAAGLMCGRRRASPRAHTHACALRLYRWAAHDSWACAAATHIGVRARHRCAGDQSSASSRTGHVWRRGVKYGRRQVQGVVAMPMRMPRAWHGAHMPSPRTAV